MKYFCTFYISTSDIVCIQFDKHAMNEWYGLLKQTSGDWKYIIGLNGDCIMQYYDIESKPNEDIAGEIVGKRLSELGFNWKVVNNEDKETLIELWK